MQNWIQNNLLKVSILWTLFLLTETSYATVSQRDNYHVQAMQAAKQKGLPLFEKVIREHSKENWDSVLVNSNRLLGLNTGTEVQDYLHAFRGEAFLRKGLFKQALNEFNRLSPQFAHTMKITVFRAEVDMEQEHFELALSGFLKIDTANAMHVQQIKLDGVLHNMGICYFYLGKYKQAEKYLKQALRHVDKKNNQDALIYFNMDLANLYYEQYRDEEAFIYFNRAYELARAFGDYKAKKLTAYNMAVYWENQKKFDQALTLRKEYENWQDSLMDQNKIYEVAQKEKRFAIAQKQREVKLLQTENKLKQTERNLYFIVALSLLIILSFGIFLYRQNVKRSRIIFSQKQELDKLNTMKDRLFSIVSHDLRSSVAALKHSNSSLHEHITSGRYEEAESQLGRNTSIAANTYNLLDNLLHWAMLQTKGGYFRPENHRLSMLVDQVVYNVQTLLQDKNLEFNNELPKSVKAYVDAESLKIVFRNFMDNSIKFSDPGASITISLIKEDERTVTIRWKDTGKGMTEETRLKLLSDTQQLTKKEHEKEIGSGLGMNLCKSMIHKNKGNLDIRSILGEGTEFIVTLQKNSFDGTTD